MGKRQTRFAPAALVLATLALAGCIPAGRTVDRTPYAPAGPLPAETRDPEVVTLPAPAPAWEARRVIADAQEVAATDYVVRPGDTLRAIANVTGAGSEAIARANGIAPPFTIRAGQRLVIPGGRYHEVRGGETGIAIARAYRVPWGEIVNVNALAEPYILRVGQRILIPGDTRTVAAPPSPGRPAPGATRTLAERAAAFDIGIDDLITGSEPAIRPEARPVAAAPRSDRALPATTAVAPPARLAGAFAWPASGTILSRFGKGASGERNDGIKIAVPMETPVLAAADGVVVYADSEVPALGGLVMIKHGDNWTTVYGHASRLLVRRGQSVKRGDRIALSGASGFAPRPQLHFEMRQGRTPVDPLTRLPRN